MRLRRKLTTLLWRLDGQMERRMIAYAFTLALTGLLFGPSAFRAVAQVMSGTPQIVVQTVSPATGATAVTLRAETSGGTFLNLSFLVRKDGDTAPIAYLATPAQTGLWERQGVAVIPGATYFVHAQGLTAPSTSNPTSLEVVTDPPVVFAVPVAQTGPICGDDVCQAGESTASCVADCPAPDDLCGDDVCQAGETTASCVADCPAPDDTTSGSGTGDAQPAARIEFMTPPEGASFAGPAPLRVRILDGVATAVLFDVVGSTGIPTTVSASLVDGTWFAPFTASPGLYAFTARATILPVGATISTAPFARGFTLLQVETPPAETATSTTETAATDDAFPSPAVELKFPSEGSVFSGPVPLAAEAKNGEVGSLRFLVRDLDLDKETIVFANRAAGDNWIGNFEGVPGHYRVRARATFAGPVDLDSNVRDFVIVGQTTVPVETSTPIVVPPAPTQAETTEVPPPPDQETPEPVTAEAEASSDEGPPPASDTTTEQPDEPPDEAEPTPDLRRLPPELQQPYDDVPPTLALECRTSGIVPERCRAWLAAKYQDRTCLEAGATTRESCSDLRRAEGGEADERGLIGLATKAEIEGVRESIKTTFGESTAVEDLPPGVEAFLPFRLDDRRSSLLTLPSASDERLGEEAAPALLVLDRDADGLPDDLERRIGSDPNDPDSDDDGFLDGVEVRNGYDPAGEGRLKDPPRGVEAAILAGAPLEEPRSLETTDESFVVEEAAPDIGEAGSDVVRLSGRAAPNTVVSLFIYSYLPVVVTTTTDADGNWRYDFSSRLAEGRHEAYVAVNDETGKLVASSRPLAFFVKEARAVSEADFLRADVDVEEAPTAHIRAFVIGGVVLVLLALVLTVAIVRQVRRNPVEPPPGAGAA